MLKVDNQQAVCAVAGVIRRPGAIAMCSAILVGGNKCGSDQPCPHKLLPFSVTGEHQQPSGQEGGK